MGWAIKRPDGTYRCWNANAKNDVLQPGEVWEERATMPPILLPPSPREADIADARAKAQAAVAGGLPELKAAVQALAKLL